MASPISVSLINPLLSTQTSGIRDKGRRKGNGEVKKDRKFSKCEYKKMEKDYEMGGGSILYIALVDYVSFYTLSFPPCF